MEIFFDGACPLCVREMKMLRGMDTEGQFSQIDISAADFSPESYGKTQDWFDSAMRIRLDGEWKSGVESFRQIYGKLGFKKSVAVSRWPVISQILGAGYWSFAKIRPHLPGRRACDTDCKVPGKEQPQ